MKNEPLVDKDLILVTVFGGVLTFSILAGISLAVYLVNQ